MAIFGKIYSPLSLSVSMKLSEGTLTQEYDADNSEYIPDRRIRPASVIPVVRVYDPAKLIDSGIVNQLLTDINWYEGEIKTENRILDSDLEYSVDRTSATEERGRITIFKNVPFNEPFALSFTATFVDMINGKVRRKAYVQGSVNLSTATKVAPPVEIKYDYPRGKVFNPLLELKALKLNANLVVNNNVIPAAYWWYRKNGDALSLIDGLVGDKTSIIDIPTSEITGNNRYVCKMEDCRKYVGAEQEKWLKTELEKIQELPRNLLPKQYLLDWNTDFAEGITTKGNDADGEYYKFNQWLLYNNTGIGVDDIFNGKIKYKEKTQYRLKISWKPSITGESGAFFVFYFNYTDGSKSSLSVTNNADAVKVNKFLLSTKGKTITKITIAPNISNPVLIYDIQLCEANFKENLIDSDNTFTVGDGSDTSYQKKEFVVNDNNIKLGNTYTLYVKSLSVLLGSSITKAEVRLQQINESGVNIPLAAKHILVSDIPQCIEFSLSNEKFDNSRPLFLVIYSGNNAASTNGNKIQIDNAMLLSGTYTTDNIQNYIPMWIPAAEDLKVESETIGLPENYRPEQQGDNLYEQEFMLVKRFPRYDVHVVTPWGNDRDVIQIPDNVNLVPASLQVDTVAGTVTNPEKYFSADWGGGVRGMNVMLDMAALETGTQVIEPTLYEDMSKVKYGVIGVIGDATKLEDIINGTRFHIIVKTKVHISGGGVRWVALAKNYKGFAFSSNSDGRKTTVIFQKDNSGANKNRPFLDYLNNEESIFDIDFTYQDDISLSNILINGQSNRLREIRDSSAVININTLYLLNGSNGRFLGCIALFEIYSPEGTLLHKWDFEGETDEERLSDKAATDNPINLIKGEGFEFVPI